MRLERLILTFKSDEIVLHALYKTHDGPNPGTSARQREVEKRYWNRAVETPVLIDVFDWTDDRLIFSVLVWPSLESSVEDATSDHHERVQVVKEVIAKGAAEMAWSTRYETDHGLKWDHERQVWTTQDGFAYDGSESSAEAGTHDAA
jgi:hypothetical protein